MLDVLIKGALVFDGTGGPPRKMAVGIGSGQIRHLGETLGSGAAKQTIDADGCWLSPGFIDCLASCRFSGVHAGRAEQPLSQGVTTELTGSDGTSAAPIGPNLVGQMDRLSRELGFQFQWRDLKEYFYTLETFGLPVNVGTLIGHATLRGGLMDDWHEIRSVELQQMKTMLEEALAYGAFGLSSHRNEPPSCFAHDAELNALVELTASCGGIYAGRLSAGGSLQAAVDEVLSLGHRAGLPVFMTGLLQNGLALQDQVPDLLKRVENYRREYDVQAMIGLAPYRAVTVELATVLAGSASAGTIDVSEWQRLDPEQRKGVRQRIEAEPPNFDRLFPVKGAWAGLSLAEAGKQQQRPALDIALDLIAEDAQTAILDQRLSEADLDAAVLWPNSLIGNGGKRRPLHHSRPQLGVHPNSAFSRFLQRYVFDTGQLSYGEAIAKITSKPADFLGLTGRGRIQTGHVADLLILDPNAFSDHATHAHPDQPASGIRYLWLNGKAAIHEGVIIDATRGRILRKSR